MGELVGLDRLTVDNLSQMQIMGWRLMLMFSSASTTSEGIALTVGG